MSWKATKRKDIVEISIEYKPRKDWEQWILLTSDRHWDNPKSNRGLQKKHLELAQKRNAIVLDGGDLFCAMQGKGDNRGAKSDIRPEHNTSDYLDSLVTTAAKWFDPYRDNIAMLAEGNHEAAVYNRKETNLTKRLSDCLGTIAMPITGFVRLIFREPRPSRSERKGYRILLQYHHGYGGGGPVTRDVIQTNRKAVYLADADIVWSGHVHESFIVPVTRLHVTNCGHIQHRHQWHIKTPSYKESYQRGSTTWENLNGMPPKPLGCVWLRFYYSRESTNKNLRKPGESTRRIRFEPCIDLDC